MDNTTYISEKELYTVPEIGRVLGRARNMRTQEPDLRRGQAVFNAAAELFPGPTRLLAGTSVDPFYQDSKVPFFLTQLLDLLTNPATNWDDN